ncbi:polysaccharide deacetylase family protein [Dyadobacter chenwenxiniae]|uniref:Polysaccharide deacetylase family protein n=1 Tax=Dyadobacter chenwenxiniae TaxID=2906456 RepID=A0A9X1PIA7_9BACT|nr:polysaccharide deacetylase family protein [Dyadobacter chenwenxiniae]MCF0061216.1 polysaccharide deacetylase family protein [Dyadobacter chenwenxiniae]UON81040.1 polysaccharide deacetylase family protein [Dyadobacter chenwenxiniae]
MKKHVLLAAIMSVSGLSYAQQRSVSITIDDIPNVHLAKADGSSGLLQKLDSLKLPVAIFINEANLKQTPAAEKNRQLLKSWVLRDYVTVGNHSFSHPNYAEVGFDAFKEEVIKGEVLTKELLKGSGKSLDYFRFPFNSMGKDSIDFDRMQQFLKEKKYISTPYTVESEDWLYARLYDKALREGDAAKAKSIGMQYVETSVKIFAFFDSLSVATFDRPIKQIYLCHDSQLNTDYLPQLVQKLKDQQYNFISLGDAMTDPVYKSKEHYKGPFGFSWIYRWIQDPAKRRAMMRLEPQNMEIHKAHEEMNAKK